MSDNSHAAMSAISSDVATRLFGTPARATVAAAPSLPDPAAYAWSIAKWAWALCVAERGLDCCDTQPMRDLMLGRRDDVFAFVGTPADRAPASREWLHDVAFHERDGWHLAQGHWEHR